MKKKTVHEITLTLSDTEYAVFQLGMIKIQQLLDDNEYNLFEWNTLDNHGMVRRHIESRKSLTNLVDGMSR